MDRLFLDANVLFSAAYRRDSSLWRLWSLPRVKLTTSQYAAEEARRNLATLEQRATLEELLRGVIVTTKHNTDHDPCIDDLPLPDKDRPILQAAVEAGATHLLTGDVRHFGAFYGQRPFGILILPPAAYLNTSEHADDDNDDQR